MVSDVVFGFGPTAFGALGALGTHRRNGAFGSWLTLYFRLSGFKCRCARTLNGIRT